MGSVQGGREGYLFSVDPSLRGSQDLGPALKGCQPKHLSAPRGSAASIRKEPDEKGVGCWPISRRHAPTWARGPRQDARGARILRVRPGQGQPHWAPTRTRSMPRTSLWGPEHPRRMGGPRGGDPSQTQLQGLQVLARLPQKPCQDASPTTAHPPIPTRSQGASWGCGTCCRVTTSTRGEVTEIKDNYCAGLNSLQSNKRPGLSRRTASSRGRQGGRGTRKRSPFCLPASPARRPEPIPGAAPDILGGASPATRTPPQCRGAPGFGARPHPQDSTCRTEASDPVSQQPGVRVQGC